MKPISINAMNIAARFIVPMFKFNIDDKASQFVIHKFRFVGVNLNYSALKSYNMRDLHTNKVRGYRTSLSELYI